MRAIGRREVSLTGAAGKLNSQAGSIHIGAIFIYGAISGLLASRHNGGVEHTESCGGKRQQKSREIAA